MSDQAPPRFKYSRHVFVTISALCAVAIVVVGRAVILPFLLAVLVAYVLFPAVLWVERRRIPRWVAILMVYAVTIGAATGFAWAVVPRLFEEVKSLATDLPRMTSRIREGWLPAVDARLRRWAGPAVPKPAAAEPRVKEAPIVITPRPDGAYEVRIPGELKLRDNGDGSWSLQPRQDPKEGGFSSERALRDAFDKAVGYAQQNGFELLAIGRQIVSGISRGVFYFFITLMLAGYMMVTYEGILAFTRAMFPAYRRESLDHFLHRLDRSLAGVVRGQILICLVNGLLTAIGLWIFDVKYWPILAIIAAAMSIIPIFGSILSTIPAVAVALTQSFGSAMWVLLWIIGIHQLEANFLNPKIIGDSAKIHPVLVVFSLLVGEHFFQITGALLAVPCLALVQAVFLHFRESVLGLPSGAEAQTESPAEPAVADTASDAAQVATGGRQEGS